MQIPLGLLGSNLQRNLLCSEIYFKRGSTFSFHFGPNLWDLLLRSSTFTRIYQVHFLPKRVGSYLKGIYLKRDLLSRGSTFRFILGPNLWYRFQVESTFLRGRGIHRKLPILFFVADIGTCDQCTSSLHERAAGNPRTHPPYIFHLWAAGLASLSLQNASRLLP